PGRGQVAGSGGCCWLNWSSSASFTSACAPRFPPPAGRRSSSYPLMKPATPARGGAAPAIVWLRHDLRLVDNPALHAACRRGGPVVPVFIWAPEEEGAWPPGGASRWWLHQSLGKLVGEFRAAGVKLIIRQGASLLELLRVVKATGAKAVFWNRRY